MKKYEKEYRDISAILAVSQSICIVSHISADGDTYGSVTALWYVLQEKFPKKQVHLFNADRIPDGLLFLSGDTRPFLKIHPKKYDLFIFCDTPHPHMSGMLDVYPDIFLEKTKKINIDHHVTNTWYAQINLIDDRQPSTTIVVYHLLSFLGYTISTQVATSLLTGIYTDTGSFLHPNTSAQAFEIAGKLVTLGGQPHLPIKNIFQNNSMEFLQAVGKIMKRTKILGDGIVFTYIRESDVGSDFRGYDELKSLVISTINMITEARYACVLQEKGGQIKGSLRTNRDDIDLTKFAARFGGGGHPKASGFTIQGTFVDTASNGRLSVRTQEGKILVI